MRTDVLLGLTLGGALALGVAATLIVGGPRSSNQDARTSTLVPGPDGSQAVHETLAELGVPVRRRRTALFDLSERAGAVGTLAVLAPPQHLLAEELAEVVRYIRAGGAIVAAGDGGGITGCVGYQAQRADSGRVVDGGSFFDFGKATAVRPPEPGWRLPPVRRVLVPWEVTERFERPGMRRLTDAKCGLLVPLVEDTLLASEDGRAVVLALSYKGGGRVLVVADPVYFRNRAWRDTDAPYFVVPLLVPTPERRGPLVWDEYHQGFATATGASGVLWTWLWRSPAGWAILQLTAVTLVWLAVTAVRFGPAQAVIERRRRSPLEHLDALATGLEGANGADTAVDLILSGLRRRLSRTGQAGGGDVASWLAALELALPTARGRAAARVLQRLRKDTGGAERVLAAAQAVEDVWQDLRPAPIPARS